MVLRRSFPAYVIAASSHLPRARSWLPKIDPDLSECEVESIFLHLQRYTNGHGQPSVCTDKLRLQTSTTISSMAPNLSRKELLGKVYKMVPPMLEKFHKGEICRARCLIRSSRY